MSKILQAAIRPCSIATDAKVGPNIAINFDSSKFIHLNACFLQS
jgi:hypothetical protein